MTEKPDAAAHGSESENPAIDTPTPKTSRPRTSQDWWPDQLDLQVLRKHSATTDPMGGDFRYADEFAELDVEALKGDLVDVMTTSQDWWPADFGHYGGLFIRMSWHAAGTYRIADGRGGAGDGAPALRAAQQLARQRQPRQGAPPALAGQAEVRPARSRGPTCSCSPATSRWRTMGFETFGFGFGREDVWEPEEIFWGPEDTWLGDERYSGDRELAGPLGAVQMGLIYVNPEGPNGNPDPVAAARDIRETFPRMAMNDEETVALIAGGHTFGKTHGAATRRPTSGPEPEGCPVDAQGLGWKNTYGTGKGADTITSGIEVTWTSTPTQWDNGFFDNLFGHEWELTKSPAGAHQWVAKDADGDGAGRARPGEEAPPDDADHRPRAALRPGVREDLAALPRAPRGVRRRRSPRPGTSCCTATWARSTRYLGPWVPEPQLWQDPVPAVDHELVGDDDVAALKQKLLDSGLSVSQLAGTAWASAVQLPRHRQARWRQRRPDPAGAAAQLGGQRAGRARRRSLDALEQVQQDFNAGESAQADLARRPDRARRLARPSSRRPGTPVTT